MPKFLVFLFVLVSVVLLADYYFYMATKSLVEAWSYGKYIKTGFWLTTMVLLGSFGTGYYLYKTGTPISGKTRVFLQGVIFVLFVPRLFALGCFVLDDLIRGIKWLVSWFNPTVSNSSEGLGISRSKFLQLSGLAVFGIFAGIFTYGIFRGAYNYNVIKNKVKIKGLPDQFKGLKIVQISDLHLGSFLSSKPIEKAIEIINEQQADFIFFTGDLVNEIAEEAAPFIPVLSKLKAKEGVFSILGNHDYGDYFYDRTAPDFVENKKHNKDLMRDIHEKSGFKLLLDESVNFSRDGESIAIIGVENWGAKARFPKYGKLHKAIKGTEKSKVKLLLSHDPSHWDAQVKQKFKDIDVTFSGHTHGMQFGIEIPGIKWSPVKYVYKQWAGMYEHENQKLYVNRGLGFIGYPGRVGISPEISVFELES